MKRFLLFLTSAVFVAAHLGAQPIPGRYIVEFQTEPAANIAAQAGVSLAGATGPAAGQVAARRAQIQAEHAAVEPAIRALGGTVTRHYDTVFNGVAVSIDDRAAAQLRQLPGVREVYPDQKHKLNLDHVVKVHHITDTWQALPNGMAGAGAGIKIGMLDTGIDINHPGFQGFSTPIPQGFPIVSSKAETANTNNKVIVSRDYSGAGGLDAVVGHGTGTSMVAAGLTNDPMLPGVTPLTGAAPAAWLGNYRVLDDSGSGSSTEFIAALNDAVTDGMNVINYSAGAPDTTASAEAGAESRAIDAAVAAGVIVVIAAGNNGPEPSSIGDPGVAPSALTVGSNENERYFDFAVTVSSLPPYEALVPDSEQGVIVTPVSGPVTDVTALDGNGYGCAGFPASSLTGQIALISRGSPNANACAFDTKLAGAQQAGAIGAIVYDNKAEAGLVDMSITSTLPATFLSQASGQDLKSRVAASPGLTATIDFTGFVAFFQSSDQLSTFSSAGPTPSAGLKPELLATGGSVLTAYTTLDPNNFGPPYQLADGTSLSTPAVTGSMAVLMGARPGLTGAQYRSLLVNSTGPLVNSNGALITPQAVGTGKLNLLQAVQNNLAAVPPGVNFRTAAGTIDSVKTVTFTNVGSAPDTFAVVVNPINTSGPAPSVDVPTFTLAPGASQTVSVHLAGTGLPTGEYDGFLAVSGTQTSVATRVPYWFGVPGNAVKYISTLLYDPGPYSAGDTATIIIRSADPIGMPFDAGTPTTTLTGVRSSATVAATGDIPGTYQITVHVGRADANGLNVVTVTAGGVSLDLPLVVQ
ncbi:MAG TPA: S8 family serine peptidase [Bryobacteraceae bacterium]|nr:S8 family serine peptidase [Bryobacteraceae bacterium]